VFLDWAKGFDKVELACLDTAVTRHGVPEDMRRMTRALAESPELVVAMSGGVVRQQGSDDGDQARMRTLACHIYLSARGGDARRSGES